METKIKKILQTYNNNPHLLMDILLDVQDEFYCVPEEAVKYIAQGIGLSEADVEQTLSFYHFFTSKPAGKYAVYLNNSAVALMMGANDIAEVFEKEAGCCFGEVTKDGLIGLHFTADIGMNDQEPAALINGKIFPSLNAAKVKQIVQDMKSGKNVDQMITTFGDGANASPLVRSAVKNNIIKKGSVLFTPYETGTAMKKVAALSPDDVISELKLSNVKGRGGAGFSTGMKWDFCKKAQGNVKYVICNADEGEPGTFKDRVLLTELPVMLFEGMAIGGYAIGAQEGILYLRAEYRYLKNYLEDILVNMRKKNLLGKNIAGKPGFDFDIRIQIGAGAYICGEESALIESAEGKRGEPRNRPPFPVTKGYMDKPSIVNNVETFCSVTRIIEKGGAWYNAIGTKDSSGTKVLSISGDTPKPGVYEIDWGMTVKEMIQMAGADPSAVQAVQVAGPSGTCIPPSQFERKIAYEDLATGGSMIIIGKQRDIIKDLVLNFMEFFADESCGSCVTCRALNVLLRDKVNKILQGKGIKKDLEDMESWSQILRKTTRCGLGQTSSNPITTTLQNFKELYLIKIKTDTDYLSEFDMAASVKESCEYVGRKPNHD